MALWNNSDDITAALTAGNVFLLLLSLVDDESLLLLARQPLIRFLSEPPAHSSMTRYTGTSMTCGMDSMMAAQAAVHAVRPT